ncbi:MAG: hypothetical protein ACKOOG_03660 [Actinomycetota bacterium]
MTRWTARPVLEAADRLARLLATEAVAVQVRENGSGTTARATASAAGVLIVVRDAAEPRAPT